MVNVSTLFGWDYSDNVLGWELDEASAGNVKLLYYKVCCEFYDDKNGNKFRCCKETSSKIYQRYTHINTEIHTTAALRLKEKALISCTTADSSSNVVGTNNQTTLLPHVWKYTALQRSQLTRKFQLAHYMAATGQSFKAYANFANFEKNTIM